MAKLTLKDITSGFLATQTINDNNALIEALVETFLSRDGLAPNTMLATLDMNSNRIINLGAPTNASDGARLKDVQDASIVTQFPSQTGNAGRIITTDGATITWVDPDSVFSTFMSSFLVTTSAPTARTVLDVYSKGESDQRDQDGSPIFALDTGSADSVVIAPSPAITAYVTGQKFRTLAAATNTGATIVSVNAIGALPLNNSIGGTLLAGDIVIGQPIEFILNSLTEARLTVVPPVIGEFPIGYLQDPTITRDTDDSFTVGRFQVSPLLASTPIATTTSSIARQLTNLFQRATAGLAGIVENTGAFAPPAESTQADVTFSIGPNRITAGSGTPYSAIVAGDKIIVDGSTSNDGTFDVSAATATTIDTVQLLTVEGAGASVSIYRVPQNTTFHVHAVRETATGNIDIAADDNKAGTNIGSGASTGWTQVRRLWSFRLNASTDLIVLSKFGNHCFYQAPQVFTPAALVTINVPSGLNLIALVTQHIQNIGVFPAQLIGFFAGHAAPTLSDPTAQADIQTLGGAPTSGVGIGLVPMVTNTSAQIAYVISAGDVALGSVQGYIDERKE